MDYLHIQNIAESSADINLFADIGGDINSQNFVNEINFLDSLGLDEINVRINSKGGSVFDGFGIFMAIKNAKTVVNTVVDGVALSIAGIILQAGDTRKMVDFGMFMMHDPSFASGRAATDKQRDVLSRIKDSLISILAGSTNKKKAQTIDKMMSEETFMNAQEALDAGFIDEVISTSRRPIKNTIEEVYNMANHDDKPIINNNQLELNLDKMEDLKNHLGLEVEATENDMLDKVKELENKVAQSEKATKEEATNHEGTLQALKDAEDNIKVLNAKLAENAVENAIKDGKFAEEAKEEMIAKATEDLDAFNAIVDAVKVTPKAATVTNLIVTEEVNNADNRGDWTYHDWAEKDSEGLLNMKKTDIEAFNKLYSDTFNK